MKSPRCKELACKNPAAENGFCAKCIKDRQDFVEDLISHNEVARRRFVAKGRPVEMLEPISSEQPAQPTTAPLDPLTPPSMNTHH